MKYIFSVIIYQLLALPTLCGQNIYTDDKARQDIHSLIDAYSKARDNKDTELLKSILTSDIDQLVSTGDWRNGIQEAVEGMQRSSTSNPGDRKLIIDKIRYVGPEVGIVDAKYIIENADGSSRNMWSTFIVVLEEERWKIAGIRNMLPSGQQ
ncbi:hypothetical protein BH23BAC1_BH23BAC1_23670 [soil metagenome]